MIFFVTGGSRGIGRGIVLHAIGEGHDVAFCYRRNDAAAAQTEREAQDVRPGCRCKGYQLDVSDSAQVETVIDQVVQDFDTVDVVVNCAGINRDNLLVSMSDEEWADVVATNLTGPFYVIRQLLPTFMANRFGRIINISSVQSNGGSGQGNYAASKAGLHGLTRTLAKEYGRRGITANVIVPGFFETDMTRETLTQQNRDHWATHCPSPKGRMGEVHELASLVTYLASDGAAFINGEIIRVTGGLDWTG